MAIVDDQTMVAQALGYVVANEADMELAGTAGSLRDAVTLVSATRPEVVLMDYRLPDGDGAQATRSVLARAPRTKVIMLSGLGIPDLLARAVEAGCAGLLSKDRPLTEIVAAIRAAHRGESILKVDELSQLLEQLRTGPRNRGDTLTERERTVLRYLAKAWTIEAIAAELFLSVHTVRNHVQNTLTKLGVHSRLEAVAVGIRDGVIPVTDVG